MRDRRRRRDVHGLNADGMVACNPRDREAAHRAESEGIVSEDLGAVTCAECRKRLLAAKRDRGKAGRQASVEPRPSPAFEVRRATAADLERFVEQRLAIFRQTNALQSGPEAETLERSTRAAFVSGIGRGSASVWLAVGENDEVAGSAALHVLDRFPSPQNPVPFEGYVSHVFVTPAWRRRGVGTALVRAMVDEARARGLRRIRLHATESGRGLYEAQGFRLRSNDMELRL